MIDDLNQLNPAPLIKKYFDQAQIGPVLDIGCGKGDDALFLAKNGFNVTAIDINAKVVENLLDKSEEVGVHINAVCADVKNFEFADRYSMIIAMNSLFFLSKDEFIDTIEKIKKSTATNGIIMITSFTDQDSMFEKMNSSNDYSMTDNRSFQNKNHRWYFLEIGELEKYFKNNFEIIFINESVVQDKGHHGALEPHQHSIARIVVKKI